MNNTPASPSSAPCADERFGAHWMGNALLCLLYGLPATVLLPFRLLRRLAQARPLPRPLKLGSLATVGIALCFYMIWALSNQTTVGSRNREIFWFSAALVALVMTNGKLAKDAVRRGEQVVLLDRRNNNEVSMKGFHGSGHPHGFGHHHGRHGHAPSNFASGGWDRSATAVSDAGATRSSSPATPARSQPAMSADVCIQDCHSCTLAVCARSGRAKVR